MMQAGIFTHVSKNISDHWLRRDGSQVGIVPTRIGSMIAHYRPRNMQAYVSKISAYRLFNEALEYQLSKSRNYVHYTCAELMGYDGFFNNDQSHVDCRARLLGAK